MLFTNNSLPPPSMVTLRSTLQPGIFSFLCKSPSSPPDHPHHSHVHFDEYHCHDDDDHQHHDNDDDPDQVRTRRSDPNPGQRKVQSLRAE